MRKTPVHLRRLVSCLFVGLPALAGAQIRTDGSVGPAQTLSGPNVLIPQSLGRLAGANLFHSFTEFNVGRGESATFSTSSAGIANVISRVTGGSASSINGRILLAAGGTPAFWLINPAGVTFGPGAVLDVPGAFHVSTADSLKFPDGEFHAAVNRASTFSTANPEAFGFLGTTRASVRVAGSTLGSGDAPFSVVAGDISVDAGSITNRGGDLRIVAVGRQAAAVPLTGPPGAAGGDLFIANGGMLQTNTRSATDSGSIRVAAGSLRIDGRNQASGIVTEALAGSSGNAGDIDVTVGGEAALASGGRLRSNTYARGNSGAIHLDAGGLSIDGGRTLVFSGLRTDAREGSSGGSGEVVVRVAGDVTIASGGGIESLTNSARDAGRVAVAASSLRIDNQTRRNPNLDSYVSSITFGGGRAGDVEVLVHGELVMERGEITSKSMGTGDGGRIEVVANDLRMGRSRISGGPLLSGRGNGGDVDVRVRNTLEMFRDSDISSDAHDIGNAGKVSVAAGALTVGGGESAFDGSEISSSSGFFASGSGGPVSVNVAGTLRLVNGGTIRSNAESLSTGNGGSIRIRAGSLWIDPERPPLAANRAPQTGIFSGNESLGSGLTAAGSGGSIDLSVSGETVILDGGLITSSTTGSGRAGPIRVATDGLRIDGHGTALLTGIFSTASDSTGAAGDIEVSVGGHAELIRSGRISSSTYTSGQAGAVRFSAGSLTVDGRGELTSVFTGISSDTWNKKTPVRAGAVEVRVAGATEILDGAQISSMTLGAGDGGSVQVRSGSLRIENNATPGELNGIFGIADIGSTGSAGTVSIEVDGLAAIGRGGSISSEALGAGRAGSVTMRAGQVDLRSGGRISAQAKRASAGRTGNIVLTAADFVSVADGGRISIENDATRASQEPTAPSRLIVSAPVIALSGGGEITAAATGSNAASAIEVNFASRLDLDGAAIRTSARDGNGGDITVSGPGALRLSKSQVTTSVAGSTGNGGDIAIRTGALAMDSGFIQANTAAANASGGDVAIDVRLLVPSGNSLRVGGSTPYAFRPERFGFNVIQAAAPTGLSGTIQITSPSLDIAGSLGGLEVRTIDSGGLGRNPCQTSAGSSLALGGRGGLPPSARETLTIEAAAPVPIADRLPPPKPLLLARAETGCKQ